MIHIKTPSEIEIMSQGGQKLSRILEELKSLVRPGITTLDIERKATELIADSGGEPSFKTVKNYRYSTCITINEEIVHGLPSLYTLKTGDIISIDIGLLYRGFHTDTSTTVPVGEVSSVARQLLAAGILSLKSAIASAVVGNTIFNVSKAMEAPILEKGYSPSRSLTGHGIGRQLHEEPQVPCFSLGKPHHSPLLKPGMCLALETIYSQGTSDIIYKNHDNWTLVTRDGSLSGLFEVTVAIGYDQSTHILTPLPELNSNPYL